MELWYMYKHQDPLEPRLWSEQFPTIQSTYIYVYIYIYSYTMLPREVWKNTCNNNWLGQFEYSRWINHNLFLNNPIWCEQGTGCEMYTETLSPSFIGMSFGQAAETCFVRVRLIDRKIIRLIDYKHTPFQEELRPIKGNGIKLLAFMHISQHKKMYA